MVVMPPARRDSRYSGLVRDVSTLLESARSASARAVNTLITATYWEIGRRVVEFEQGGARRAAYGTELLDTLSADLTRRFGRGFSRDNLETMRLFYLAYRQGEIPETASRKSPDSGISGTLSRKSPVEVLGGRFPLPWSHYVLLVRRTRSPEARCFYQTEALRGGWSVRQLDRQIASRFYERTALSRNKAAMLTRGARPQPEDRGDADGEIRDPLVLEFLGLRDEYSEDDLEEALVRHLESFLLELGGDFAFIGRQRRLRIGDEWYRIDLLFFHRRLRCLVVIDLKVGKFTHADAGQMHLYLNYAREHWMRPDENPPVGLILCSQKNDALVRYALDGLPSKVLAREYRVALPDEKRLAAEIERTRQLLEARPPNPIAK
jgi:predicted nuclease of restriction endonuclease-like (RecB) superfamily